MPSGERRCCGDAAAVIYAAALPAVGIAGVDESLAVATEAALSGASEVATAGHARAIFGKAVGAADSAIGVTLWRRLGRGRRLRPDHIDIVPTARATRAAVLELGNSAEPSTCVVADGLGLSKRLIVLATLGKRVSAHDSKVN